MTPNECLIKLGYATRAVDGISGKLTISALKNFYRDNDKVFVRMLVITPS